MPPPAKPSGWASPAAAVAAAALARQRAQPVPPVGDAERGRRVTLVHVSDTHGKAMLWRRRVPEDFDILVHSGDFCAYEDEGDLHAICASVNAWFDSFPQPASHKIFVAGNHELAFHGLSQEALQALLPSCTYLQDSGCVVEGLRVWGTPWNNCRGMAFGDRREMRARFEMIPDGVDVVVTHQPPWNVLDLAWERGPGVQGECSTCGAVHPRYSHWGSRTLLARLRRVRPLLSLFGHVHDARGTVTMDSVTYVNSAMDLNPKPSVCEVYVSSE